MLHVVQNQLISHVAALPDVMTYVLFALSSDTYAEPVASASNFILYPRPFEDVKTIM
jgi:hypothetical protein